MLKNFIRALRLPFISASALPFIFGSLSAGRIADWSAFYLGLGAGIFAHLSANLINDYADSRSGADWQDTRFYGFFGGSKLIQEKIFSEQFYLGAALCCAFLAAVSAICLAAVLRRLLPLGLFLAIIFLSWSYSARPLQLAYRRLGEIIIFLLFGPAPVMGGYFIQTGIFPDWRSFLLSLPFGFLTCAILFANEVPDYAQDLKAGKLNWVGLTGARRAFILYLCLTILAYAAIAWALILKYLGWLAWGAFIFVFLGLRAAKVLKENFDLKDRLIESSRLTIIQQNAVGVALILSLILCKR